jgi:hypothetical protein
MMIGCFTDTQTDFIWPDAVFVSAPEEVVEITARGAGPRDAATRPPVRRRAVEIDRYMVRKQTWK